jgi:hypothetical protein
VSCMSLVVTGTLITLSITRLSATTLDLGRLWEFQ